MKTRSRAIELYKEKRVCVVLKGKMEFICECGQLFNNFTKLWKHKIELCKERKCYECKHNAPDMDYDLNEFIVKNKHFIRITHQDEFACARAILISKAFADRHLLRHFLVEHTGLQHSFAEDLHEEAGVQPGVCGINEIKLFQEALPGYQLIFIRKTCKHMPFHVVYVGPETDKRIYIYEHDGIYDTIKEMCPELLLRIFEY